MKLSDDLAWRGLIKDKTFQDLSWLDQPKTFYMGIDAASADSLTIGNLAFILLGRRLVDAGWKAVVLMGGGTSLVGDPGGKAEERQLKSREEIQHNIEGVRTQVTKLFEGENYQLVDNYEWLAPLKYVDFLRDVGKHFSMTELMQRDFVAERMNEGGAGISYAEFSYSLVQGYDFWHLHDNYDVQMQIGGSDQWGNMLSGVALIRKKEGHEVHALSMPLIVNKETGQKFGKSEGGAIWLDGAKTTPFQFYQFWINIDDADTEEYLKKFTLLGEEEIEQVMSGFNQNPGARHAQRTLAFEATKLVHGEEQAKKQQHITEVLFSGEGIGGLDESQLTTIREEFANLSILAQEPLVDILVRVDLASSNSEARRLLDNGAIYVNNKQLGRNNLEENDFQSGRLLLRRGKAFKDSALIELV